MSASPFKPAWWLFNPHLQTMWSTFCRRPIKSIPLVRERFELPDGDFLDLDWVGKEKQGPLIILLHGLEGSVQSPYAQGMLHTIHQHNWRGLFMHFRGCSGEHNRLPRSYHSGETSDLETLMKTLQQREPHTPLAAVGFSLGGNVLLKWLGETGNNNPLSAAVAVSVPFLLHKSAERIQYGFSRVYQYHFLKCLARRLSKKFELQQPPFDLPELSEIKTIWDFDDKVTAPLHGFSGVEDYYTRASSRQYLNTIQVPTLLLQAKDDPFMSPDVIPERHELSPYVKLEVTESGGHVGFISGQVPWRPEYWLEERVPAYLGEYL